MSAAPASRVSPDAILASLNPAQRSAAAHDGGPLLVLAGAGSGKTRVLTHRIAHLLATGRASARAIAAVTFTNKAAHEMRARVATLLTSFFPDGIPGEAELTVCTFHSLCVRLLRHDGPAIGVPRSFTIWDEDDRESAVRRLAKEKGVAERPGRIASAISAAKNRGLDSDELRRAARGEAERGIANVFAGYEQVLRRSAALDFDDLLLFGARLLREDESARRRWAERFSQLLVDEYQDTNALQVQLLQHLGSVHRNVCAVGDEDQSIYSFRGADVANMLRFGEDFPGAGEIRLEQNYRSTQRILTAASALVSRNATSRGKALWTERGAGEPVDVAGVETPEDEAAEVAAAVQRECAGGRRFSDFAVLVRTNAQSRPFEQVFVRWGIPHTIVGAVRFYDRREVKDALAYVRLVANPADDAAFFRIVNVPPRGLGDAAVASVREFAANRGVAARLALSEAGADLVLGPALWRKLQPLRAVLAAHDTVGATAAPDVLLAAVLETTGLARQLRSDGEPERAENLSELLADAAQFVRARPDADTNEYLAAAALATPSDGRSRDAAADPGVRVMTLHNAKGLEFPHVFLAGWEEGLLPHFSSVRSGDVEEERRLAYVGLTRARERVLVTFCRSRGWSADEVTARIPSRFLGELPDEATRGAWRAAGTLPEATEGTSATRARGGDESAIAVGDPVVHPSFGGGVVLAMSGIGVDARATVSFLDHGRKDLVLRFARLRRDPDSTSRRSA